MCQACGSSTLNYASGNGQPYVAYGGGGSNTATTVTATGNLNTDALLYGYRWANANLTFSFPTLATQYEAGYTEAGDSGFAAATAGMQASIRYALGLVSQYTNLNITEVDPATTTADIRVAQTNYDTGTAKAFLPVSDYTEAGDVWFGTSYFASRPFEKGRYAWATTMHELGHALGLKHGHETGGLTGAMDAAHDQMAYSLMTYRSYQGGPTTGYTNETYGYAQTFMMYDISAFQAMYGANFNTNSGNSTYTWSTTTGEMFINGVGQGAPGGNRIFQTIWDGNGVDTYDFSNYTQRITVDLNPGGYSAFFGSTGFSPSVQRAYLGGSQYAPGNVFNALQYNGDARSLIENANGGAGNDSIYGNHIANLLRGNGGNDTIDGGGGTDTSAYNTSYLNVTITRNIDGTLTLTTPLEGTDTLINIEQLQFTDANLSAWRFSQTDAPALANFTPGAGGWTSDNAFPRHVVDMNGDRFADIVGFGADGVWVSLGNGSGGFGSLNKASSNFAPTTGWSNDNTYHREVRDMNNDGKADLVGFGQNGVWIAYANGSGGFGAETFAVQNFGVAQGWSSQEAYSRMVADVNGDGYGDIVGFGHGGVWVSHGSSTGTFSAAQLKVSNFGTAQGWSSDEAYHRTLADVNGDGRADILGFGQSGTWVALANASNGFDNPFLSISTFGTSDGWSNNDRYTRYAADVNGDNLADILGFGHSGVWVALGTGGGHFATTKFEMNNFGGVQGWTSDNTFHRSLGDINGDGRADILGFGYSGVYLSTSTSNWLV